MAESWLRILLHIFFGKLGNADASTKPLYIKWKIPSKVNLKNFNIWSRFPVEKQYSSRIFNKANAS